MALVAGRGMCVLVSAATGYVCSERKVHQLTRKTPAGMEHGPLAWATVWSGE